MISLRPLLLLALAALPLSIFEPGLLTGSPSSSSLAPRPAPLPRQSPLASPSGPNGLVLFEAFSHPFAGGYRWEGTGVPEEIQFRGKRVLKAGSAKGTYCSGVTFSTVMKSAKQLQLLKKKSLKDIQIFQRQWYGATKESAEMQCATALETLGIGSRIEFSEALPGDFVQFWRGKSGHSAVFLGWIVEDEQIVGLHYWSSQKSTGGIGTNREYFSDGKSQSGVDRERTYFGRLGG